ncbi:MAG: PASTA domain-containing protein [Candidatus Eisenbacteria bacterium]|nr:PASTA domain-containing protein [Candidatus Eisenbacteria bacterium]
MKSRVKISPFWTIVLLALAAFVGGVLIFNFGIMPLLVGHGGEAKLPDLTLCTVPEAERRLKEEGLRLAETGSVFSADVPKGCVVSQYPPAFATVKKSRGVKINVSSGESGVSVPEIVGQSLRHAEIVLGRAGLQLGRVSQVYSAEIPADAVISTFPGPGALAEEGGTVDVLVSLGPPAEEFVMPQLVGQNVNVARNVVESAGLVLEIESGSTRTGGKVVDQRPPYGTKISRGSVVYVSVRNPG